MIWNPFKKKETSTTVVVPDGISLGVFDKAFCTITGLLSNALGLEQDHTQALISGSLNAVQRTEVAKTQNVSMTTSEKQAFALTTLASDIKQLKLKTSTFTKLLLFAPTLIQITYELWKISKIFSLLDPRTVCVTMIVVGLRALLDKTNNPLDVLLTTLRAIVEQKHA